MLLILRLWYRFEYGYNMVNAYLANQMGESDLESAYRCQAYNAKRRLDLLEIQQ